MISASALAVSEVWIERLRDDDRVARALGGETAGAVQSPALAARTRALASGASLLAGGINAWTTDGVAIVPVFGLLTNRASFWFGSSYEEIQCDVRAALADPGVRAIVLLIESPGGVVAGNSELASFIFKARGTKPIVAYVSGDGASAAYLIASAAESVAVASSALVGSIGTIWTFYVTTKADEQCGVQKIVVRSSKTPYKVIDPTKKDDLARAQRIVDELAQVFIDDVARNRGVTSDVVIEEFGGGDVFVGASAVQAGLADRVVAGLDEVIAELAARMPTVVPTDGGKGNMKDEKAQVKLAAALGVTDAKNEPAIVEALDKHEGAIRAAVAGHPGYFLTAEALVQLGAASSTAAAELSKAIVDLSARAAKAEAHVKQLAAVSIEKEVDQAIAEFKYTPAERDYQLQLARENPERWSLHTKARAALPINQRITPASKPAPASKTAAQEQAVEAYMKEHNVDVGTALRACAAADPQLFTEEA